jgi:ATP phosphoribosyltransferase regulatory subunit HisZ
METFNLISAAASILGLIGTVLAFMQAKRAAKAAIEARDAVTFRTLADELELACVRAEQLVDFLLHDRFAEAELRIGELTSSLSEMPRRRNPYLEEDDTNGLLTSREQLQSISDVIEPQRGRPIDASKRNRTISVARRVVMSLRGISGAVKSKLELGELK